MRSNTVLTPIIIFVMFLIVFLLGRGWIRGYIFNDHTLYSTHMLYGTATNLILILVSIVFIKKYQLQNLAGIGNTTLKNKWLLLFPLYLALINWLVMNELQPDNLWLNMALLGIYCLSVGFAEELSIRGSIQSYLIKHYGNTKRNLIVVVFSAALIFGMLHLFKFDKGLYGEISQVFFATFIGVMFGAILLRTRRLYPLIIIHAIIDFAAKFDEMGLPITTKSSGETSLTNAIVITLAVLPSLIYGIVLLRKVKLENL